mgnify:CR=1 FL=1|jgi:hypothetical protein
MTDHSEPITLAAFPDEMYAQMLVDALSDQGIMAEVAGGITGGFRAEAPGMVKVLIRASDKQRAEAYFVEWEHEGKSIDWNNVDLGEPEDAD